ncbi:MAG: HU family DNA-binding protein [Bacteroidaceae bacterium]|jgi:DNA-binding protein HU-beta|nr:HU family DNA-binding protein [Bacteroidaceae bacterium]
MNKTDLVAKIAEGAGLSKVDAKKALEATLDAITTAVKKDDKVVLIGFGTFSVAKRAARKGINVLTKKAINIPAKKVVKFKAGADLKF